MSKEVPIPYIDYIMPKLMTAYEKLPLKDRCFISPYNFDARVLMPNLPKKVQFDADIRELEQFANVNLNMEDKIALLKALKEIGCAGMTVGYPYRSKVDMETAKRMAEEGIEMRKTATVVGFLPDWKEEIDAAIDAQVDSFSFMMRASDVAMKYQIKLTRDQYIERIYEIMDYGKSRGVKILPTHPDITRADLNFLKTKLLPILVEAGAKGIGVADTSGTMHPLGMKYFIRSIGRILPVTHVHCHNDFGLAVANTLAAVEEGCTGVSTTVNGLGDRAGNAPLDEVAVCLECLYGVDTGIKLEKLRSLSKLCERLTGIKMAANKPLVGDFSYVYKLDSHIWGAITDPRNYEGIPPEMVGNKRVFNIGKYAGKYVINWKLEQLGLKASEAEVRNMIPLIEKKAYELKRDLNDEEFKEVYNKIVRK
jgi:2-isopropylmalate synthase